MKAKKCIFLILSPIAVLVIGFGLFLLWGYAQEYRPEPIERIYVNTQPDPLPDTLTIVSWNIGYAGLGDNMDFFYDGGTRVRDSQARTDENLKGILSTLHSLNADIMLLQEVDRASHRSYGIDQAAILQESFPEYTLLFAYNYKSRWVPIPLYEPIGKVESGLVTLSRYHPLEAFRHQYPSSFSFPSRMFNLKRALLSATFVTTHGDTVQIHNTHNTAYDAGGMRSAEMHFLSSLLHRADSLGYRTLTGGDWNQFPPDYDPTLAEISNPHFAPHPIDSALFSDLGEFAYPRKTHSLRFLNVPLGSETITTLTDFFFLSSGFNLLSIEVVPLDFRYSDHHPVVIKIVCDKNHKETF